MEKFIKIPVPDFGVEYHQEGLSGKRIQLDEFDFDTYFNAFHFQIVFIQKDKVGNPLSSIDTRVFSPKLKIFENEGGNLNHTEIFTVPPTKDLYVKIDRPNGMQPDAKPFMEIRCKIF